MRFWPSLRYVPSNEDQGRSARHPGAQGRVATAHGRSAGEEFLEFQLAEILGRIPSPGEEEELLRQRDAARRGRKNARARQEEALGILLGENGLLGRS